MPSSFKVLQSKNRNAYLLNACIARDKPTITKFRIHGGYTGRFEKLGFLNQLRINKLSGTNVAKLGYFPCFSLKTILKAIGVSHVDFFSLDVEGGELDVLKSINFTEFDIETFCIERGGQSRQVTSLLERKGYKTVKEDWLDAYYIKK